jgi:type VI secretion system protein ImpH
METPSRSETTDLVRQISEKPFSFDFYRAVRLLEARNAGNPPLGESISPRDDLVRFKQKPSLTFAPSTLHDCRVGAGGHLELFVNFTGLFGPNGPMPLFVTEFAHDRQHNGHDSTMVAFFDIFHQRLLSLFYRAWAVNQKSADLDRPDDSRFANYIGSLFGYGMKSLQKRDAVPDWAKLHFSGRLISPARNAEGLGAIVEEFFGIPALIQTFQGHWLSLPPESACRLGESPTSGSLGVTTIVGSRFWDCQLKFRIRLGPMKLADLQRMLPTGESFKRLKAWVLNYVSEEFFWDLQLVLKKEEVPPTSLGGTSALGWTSWLKGAPTARDAEDLILNVA